MNVQHRFSCRGFPNSVLASFCLLLTCVLLLPTGRPVEAATARSGLSDESLPISADGVTTSRKIYLPFVRSAPSSGEITCPATGVQYHAISVPPPPTDRPAGQHADLNLAMRGWSPITAYMNLVQIGGDTHADPPQLRGVFADHRIPTFTSAAQVYDWNWSCGQNGCRGVAIASPSVTLLGLGTRPGELVRSPSRQARIDDAQGYIALVLYAEHWRITLKYTREDNVVNGYTIHIEDVCVDPGLVALYRALDTAGRGWLPALRNDQPLGTALSGELRMAVRDTGTFMDPRSQKDWWQR